MPLFPDINFNINGPMNLRYHSTSHAMSDILISTISKLNIVSLETGERLYVFPYRIRRMIGTNAALEGHPVSVIADLLDHSDTSNAGIYVEATPAIIDRIDKSLSNIIAPLAQAFCGTLVGKYSEHIRDIDPDKYVIDPRFCSTEKLPMGICGSYSYCYLSAPVACYTCQFFNPWLDGPHDQLLEHLMRERDELKKSCDLRMASINDRTILAVRQVVELCKIIKIEKYEKYFIY